MFISPTVKDAGRHLKTTLTSDRSESAAALLTLYTTPHYYNRTIYMFYWVETNWTETIWYDIYRMFNYISNNLNYWTKSATEWKVILTDYQRQIWRLKKCSLWLKLSYLLAVTTLSGLSVQYGVEASLSCEGLRLVQGEHLDTFSPRSSRTSLVSFSWDWISFLVWFSATVTSSSQHLVLLVLASLRE